MDWQKPLEFFLQAVHVPVFGAGFKKDGLEIAAHPNLITFDGESVYFFGLREKEAVQLLDGVTLLNGKIGWLAYMLQEVFYQEGRAEEVYEVLFDALYSGILAEPQPLTKGTIYQWLDEIAPQVETILDFLKKRQFE